MIYAGIDVNIITHEKAMGAGVEAFGLWCWGMCYAQLHETNGRLPEVAVMTAMGQERRVLRRLAVRLVSAGLWIVSESGSFQVWNYGKKNQTAEEILARREAYKSANTARQQAWRDRRNARVTQVSERDKTLLSHEVTGQSPTPTPTPTPTPIKYVGPAAPAAAPTKVRGTRLSKDWTPSAETQEWSKAQGVAEPTGTVLDEFRDYWCPLTGAKATKLDWDATFRNRVRQVATRSKQLGFAKRGAELTKQPVDYEAPWMKLPEAR